MDGSPLDARADWTAARQTRRALLATVALLAAPRGHTAAAPIAQPTVETLLVLPVTSPDPPYPWFSIQLMTLEPGSVEPFGRTEFHGAGDIGFVVNQGEIGFEVDGPALVARTGGNVLANGIPVAAGSVTRLFPGDQAVTAAGVVSRRRNTGSVRAATCERRPPTMVRSSPTTTASGSGMPHRSAFHGCSPTARRRPTPSPPSSASACRPTRSCACATCRTPRCWSSRTGRSIFSVAQTRWSPLASAAHRSACSG